MTALTALDREGLCPQQQQHEKREEINLFQFKPASEKKKKEKNRSVTGVPKENKMLRRRKMKRGESEKQGEGERARAVFSTSG